MQDYISIIIPTYNRGKLIKKSIESVLNQTYPYFELIIVDDGSTDNTREIIQEIKDERIRYYYLAENTGPSKARNYGIRKARHDYIAFQDSDDIWLPNKLEKQIKKIQQYPEYSMIYTAFSCNLNGKETKVPSSKWKIEELEGNIFESLWECNKIGTPTILISKKCIEDVGGFEESIRCIEDYELVLRIAKKYKIGYINEVLLKSTFSPEGVNSNKYQMIKSLIFILKKYKKEKLAKEGKIKTIFQMVVQEKIETKEKWKKDIIPDIVESEEMFNVIYDLAKHNCKLRILNELMYFLEKDNILEKLAKYIDFEQERFAIYGTGKIGILLGKKLKEKNIKYECYVDQNDIVLDSEYVVKPERLSDNVGKVIVTIMDAIDSDELSLNINGKPELINIFSIVE